MKATAPYAGVKVTIARFAGQAIDGEVLRVDHYDTDKQAWEVDMVIPTGVKVAEQLTSFLQRNPSTTTIKTYIEQRGISWVPWEKTSPPEILTVDEEAAVQLKHSVRGTTRG